MFARLTIFQVKTDKLDETIKNWKERDIPEHKSEKGFRGAYFLTDAKQAKAFPSPFGIVKKMLLPMNKVGSTRNRRIDTKRSSQHRLFVKDMKLVPRAK